MPGPGRDGTSNFFPGRDGTLQNFPGRDGTLQNFPGRDGTGQLYFSGTRDATGSRFAIPALIPPSNYAPLVFEIFKRSHILKVSIC